MKIPLLSLIFLIANISNICAQYFGGIKNDRGVALCQANRNFYIAANTRSFGHGSEDIWIIRVNENFEYINAVEWGSQHHDIVADIISTKESGVALLGYSWDAPGLRTGLVISKYDSLLNNLWTSYFSGSSDNVGFGLIQTKDNGFLTVGYDRSEGDLGACSMIKLNEFGVLEWEKFYDTPNKDIAMDVIELHDGTIFLLANTSSFEGKITNSSDYLGDEVSKPMLIKTDSIGNELWRNFYGGDKHSFGKKLINFDNNSYLIVGSSLNNTNGNFDITLDKIDSLGNLIWHRNYGGSSYDYGNAIAINSLGEILIVGYSNSFSTNENPDLYIIKTDNNGNEIWSNFLGGDNSDYGNDVKFLANNEIALLGTTFSTYNGNSNILFHKMSSDGEIKDTLVKILPSTLPQPFFYPNPVTDYFYIHFVEDQMFENFNIKLFDIYGKIVFQKQSNNNYSPIYISKKLKSGIYTYEIKTLDNIYSGKIVVN